MAEQELSEEEILKMKNEFDKDLKKFHEKGVPEIVDIIQSSNSSIWFRLYM